MRWNLGSTMVGCAAVAAASCGAIPGQNDGAEIGMAMELIEQMPVVADDRGQIELRLVDFEGISEALSLERTDDALEWANAVGDSTSGNLLIPTYGLWFTKNDFGDGSAWESEAGFSPLDIDRLAQSSAPLEYFTLIVGPDGWGPAAVDHVENLRTIGTTDDYEQDIDAFTPLRPIGRALRVAERDGTLASSISTPVIAGWLRSDVPMLGDDDRFVDVAGQLDTAGVLSAFVIAMDFQSSGATIPEPFEVVGIGSSITDGQEFETIVYVFENAEAAAASVTEVERIWRDDSDVLQDPPVRFSEQYGSVTAEVADRAVVVTLEVEGIAQGHRFLTGRTAVFQHREV